MKNNNKKLGNDFETQFCEILFEHGFWVHNLAQNQAGQPADVIAVRNGIAHLIDCKVCSGNAFSLSRIEENQRLSMQKWSDCRNGQGWFALLLEDNTIYVCPATIMEEFPNNGNKLDVHTIRNLGVTLHWWMHFFAP